jgi:hypothetical protein
MAGVAKPSITKVIHSFIIGIVQETIGVSKADSRHRFQ